MYMCVCLYMHVYIHASMMETKEFCDKWKNVVYASTYICDEVCIYIMEQ